MNWKQEAIDKLRCYDAMQQAQTNIPQQLQLLALEARSLRSARTDVTPVKGSRSKGDDRLLSNLVHRQELTHQLRRSKVWLESANRALSVLTPEEKLILHRFYICPERGVIDKLCTELGIEQSSIYRKRDKALERFTLALYGLNGEL